MYCLLAEINILLLQCVQYRDLATAKTLQYAYILHIMKLSFRVPLNV